MLAAHQLQAQQIVNLPKSQKKISIRFQYINNFIVVKLRLNGIVPLNFILDSGAEQTIITKRAVTDLLKINYNRKYTFYGADLSRELYAYLARFVNFNLGNLAFTNQPVFVLEEDYLQLENYVGLDIHGILSFAHFSNLLIEIDYKTNSIHLSERQHLKKIAKGFKAVPIAVKDNRPYINSEVVLQNGDTVQLNLMLDSGAALALVLHNYTHPKISLPEYFIKGKIGVGLGGKVEGFIGRINQLEIENFEINNLLTQFQVVPHIEDTTRLDGRNGFVGNQILQRFRVIFDYVGNTLYLKPNKRYYKKQKADRSGLVLFATGKNLNKFMVESVIEASPAHEIDCKKDDVLLKINGLPAKIFSLNGLNKKLSKKRKRPVKITINRAGKKIKKLLYLKDYI